MAQKSAPVSVGVSLNVSGNLEDNPLGVLKGLTNALRSVESKLSEAVQEARRQKFTWEQIGGTLGISRQAAWERFSTESCSMSAPQDRHLHHRGARDPVSRLGVPDPEPARPGEPQLRIASCDRRATQMDIGHSRQLSVATRLRVRRTRQPGVPDDHEPAALARQLRPPWLVRSPSAVPGLVCLGYAKAEAAIRLRSKRS